MNENEIMSEYFNSKTQIMFSMHIIDCNLLKNGKKNTILIVITLILVYVYNMKDTHIYVHNMMDTHYLRYTWFTRRKGVAGVGRLTTKIN